MGAGCPHKWAERGRAGAAWERAVIPVPEGGIKGDTVGAGDNIFGGALQALSIRGNDTKPQGAMPLWPHS